MRRRRTLRAGRATGGAGGARRGAAAAAVAMVLAALAVTSPPARAVTIGDPGCGEMRVVMSPGTLVYTLPHGFIRAGTDSVTVAGEPWRAGVDYLLDRLRGELRLLRDPIAGDTLAVRACWLLAAPPLERQLMSYRPAAAAAAGSLTTAADSADRARRPGIPRPVVRPAAARDPSSAPPGASLTLSGNKTIAVEFGSNQDAFLRQSLDLAVSGTLAPGVELTGVLSDRNTPLTETGATQSLEALDQVRIELKAPRGSAALGDLPLELQQGEFGRLERRLQGVRGEWDQGRFQGIVAAASAPGEYHRMQFFGSEGRQGPYLLTDRDGNLGISVIAGSEVVTVDGARMTRGESADYSIDYDRARVTFSNRRPISSTSRITVEYQYSVNRYRRNLLAAGGRWTGERLFGFVQALHEADDRGRPLDLTLDAADRLRLQAAGDSAGLALGGGVEGGGGDYDTVRVGPQNLVYAFAGRGAGEFSVQFARVGEGLGDYLDSTVVAGQTTYRFVGTGQGAYQVGRALPLPEAHQLWSMGGGTKLGALSLEVEGALSRTDRNLFSSRDDGDNRGEAGRATVRLQGAMAGPLHGTAGLELQARSVGERFTPFGRLERPFAEEDWGLPLNADLEHQRRLGVGGFFRPRAGGELTAELARLRLPGGFTSLRHRVAWERSGVWTTRLQVLRSDAEQRDLRFSDGGRRRVNGLVGLRLHWIEPALRFESDERRFPSDTGRVGDRQREAGIELKSGAVTRWRLTAGYALLRDARAEASGFVDQSEARTLRFTADSPTEKAVGVGLVFQRRDLEPLADVTRTRSDLGSLRLRAEDRGRGFSGQLGLELTSEGENRRVRQLNFVGSGAGAYDALGNYVGTGDYELVVTVSPDLVRVARAATSAQASWQARRAGTWSGSRLEFDFESEARRRGEAHAADPFVSPGAVLADPGLIHGSVLQRLEGELLPDSRARAFRLRGERRVTADRAFENFAQTIDDRTLSLRWRVRPGGAVSAELETRLRRQSAAQSLSGSASYQRTLLESGGTFQLVVTPDARLRAVGVVEASWNRPEFEDVATRTLRVGPDLGVAVGARGRAELSVRRAFVSGPAAVGLLPTADPVGAPRWEGSGRFDYRVRDSATFGLSFTARDRRPRPAQVNGRAELRAFF